MSTKNKPVEPDTLTGKEASQMLNVSMSRLCKLAKDGIIRKVAGPHGNKWRSTAYYKEDILKWDERRKTHPCKPGRGNKAKPVY